MTKKSVVSDLVGEVAPLISKFRIGLRRAVEVPFKLNPIQVAEDLDAGVVAEGRLDQVGREIPDPRPIVVDSTPLSMEQKVLNQFIAAHNRAVLERDNLPWDTSSPEALAATIRDVLNMDMPDDEIEMISQYEYMPMAEDYPSHVIFQADKTPVVEESDIEQPAEQPAEE
jgi:hypothetical protein